VPPGGAIAAGAVALAADYRQVLGRSGVIDPRDLLLDERGGHGKLAVKSAFRRRQGQR
jgi:hypothetical protein